MLSMYKIKDAVQRGAAFLGAAGLLAGIASSALPGLAFADALNPLTERSLTLSSSSPGWSFKDGSGNDTYAYPNSGANGQKTGNTFSFRMSTQSATVKAITFQYCTTPAGDCIAPGDNSVLANTVDGSTVFSTVDGTGDITVTNGLDTVSGSGTAFLTELSPGSIIVTDGGEAYTVLSVQTNSALTLTANASGATEAGVTFKYRSGDTSSTSDLNVVENGSQMIDETDWTAISGSATKTPNRDGSEGNFVLMRADADTVMSTPLPQWSDYDYAADNAWTMTASNSETGTIEAGTATAKNNLITITSTNGEPLSGNLDTDGHGDYFKVIFFGTDDNYVTNPGSGAFFVRMNTYSDVAMTNLLDGGVTVANVMNESITIQTKVLETMAFSVGTHDPDKYNNSLLTTLGLPNHGQCSTLLMADPEGDGVTNNATFSAQPHNVIRLGNQSNEYSLETGKAYDGFSYWRLSSNSSGGATVYYTGHTLTNTVGDEIMPLDETPTASVIGTEQFGLGIATDTDSTLLGGAGETWPAWEGGGTLYGSYGTLDDDADGDFATFLDHYLLIAGGDSVDDNDVFAHYPRLYPLVPLAPYGDHDGDLDGSAAGSINDSDGLTLAGAVANTAKFAFNANADTYAQPIATESDQVVNCVTAKMRYIANIAATTPAGIYTTKINYVASPQY